MLFLCHERKDGKMNSIVKQIYDNCHLCEDGHFVYRGKFANIAHIPTVRYENHNYSQIRILFAYEYMMPVHHVQKLHKLCNKPLCIEPTHYCQSFELDQAELDANGWSMMRKKYLLLHLGLSNTPSPNCILFQGYKNVAGYGKIKIGRNTYYAHVISLRLKLGRKLHNNMQASHLCNNRACVNPLHLVEENNYINTRRQEKCKLTNDIILQIYHEQSNNISQREVARKYNVTQATVSNIQSGVSHNQITKHSPNAKNERVCLHINDEMRAELRQFLRTRCTIVSDPLIDSPHMIPKKTSRSCGGYVEVKKWGIKTSYHVLAAIVQFNLTRFPDAKNDELVLHQCLRKDCCAFSHIVIGSASQNAHDKKRDNTHRNHARITPELVQHIRDDSNSTSVIAKKYSTSIAIVRGIKGGRTWKDL